MDDLKNNNTFIAIVIVETYSNHHKIKPLYEEIILSVKAINLSEATEKIEAYFSDYAHSYKNQYGELINWRFREIIDVAEILPSENLEVNEIYARHFYDYKSYKNFDNSISD